MSKFIKHATAAVAVALASVLAVAALTGCMPVREQAPDAAALNRAYMAEVNTICATAADDLSTFAEAAAAGDLASMRVAANTAAATLGQIERLNVPEPMADVHAEYLLGAQELSQALNDYVALYAKYFNAEYETPADKAAAQREMEAELADIQALYDDGIGHLATADSMIAELAASDTESVEASAAAAISAANPVDAEPATDADGATDAEPATDAAE